MGWEAAFDRTAPPRFRPFALRCSARGLPDPLAAPVGTLFFTYFADGFQLTSELEISYFADRAGALMRLFMSRINILCTSSHVLSLSPTGKVPLSCVIKVPLLTVGKCPFPRSAK